MMRTQSYVTHRLYVLGCALMGAVSMTAMAVPEIVQPVDTRPDLGNSEGCAYVTGPHCGTAGLYNEDLELSSWNQPAELTFSLAKNDVWDRRYFGDRRKLVDLDVIRRMCFGGTIPPANGPSIPDSPQALYLAYDFPCPKPVGQVIIRCPDLKEPDQYAAGRGVADSLVARAAKGSARGALWAFLHRTRNLLVIQGEYSGLTQPIQVQLYRHKDTTPQGTSIAATAHYGGKSGYDYSSDPDNGPLPAPEAKTDGRFFWVRQAFPADKTFPKGFEYVMMGTVAGVPCNTQADSRAVGAGAKSVLHPIAPDVYNRMPGYLKEIRIEAERVNNAEYGALATATIEGAQPTFTVYLAVVTTRDAADPLAAAKKLLGEATRTGAEALARESESATEAQFRAWRLSRVMHYNATSCTYADATPWHGDYHFNEGQFTDTIVAGQADTLEQRLRMFEEMRPALQRNAREVYHCRGLAFSLVHYPIKSDRVVYSNFTWEWGLENTALMLQPFWQIFQYTQDKEFLRKRAYPMMAEAARFYADYVKQGEDGCYHVIPTVSQEHWGFTPEWKLNRDSVGALSFIKYHLNACIEASEILGRDAQERERWREIVQHLAPYPTLQTQDGPVFCDVRDAPELLNYNITANLVMSLWAEDISLDSPPELLELARRSYRALPDPEHSMRPGYLQQNAMNLCILDKTNHTPQGRELSWPGRLHLNAGLPAGGSLNDSFSGHLAVGGFEVSAAHVGTEVRRVRLKSLAGKPCRVKSAWPPNEVQVLDWATREPVPHRMVRLRASATGGEGAKPMVSDTIAFDTQAGHTYALLSGPEVALAGRRFVAEEKVIGKWTFQQEKEGLVPDESGPGPAAKLLAGAKLAPVEGRSVLQLPGPQSYARVERTPAFDFGAEESFSVEVRFRFSAGAAAEMVPLACSMAFKQYCLMLSRGRAKFYLSSPEGNVCCFADGKTLLADGRWHTVRGVRDANEGTVKVYVDGKLEGMAADVTTGDFACDAPVTIGAYLWGDRSRWAQGLIGEVQIKSLGRLEPRR